MTYKKYMSDLLREMFADKKEVAEAVSAVFSGFAAAIALSCIFAFIFGELEPIWAMMTICGVIFVLVATLFFAYHTIYWLIYDRKN